MNKPLRLTIGAVLLVSGLFLLLNIPVTTRQGINYQWHSIKLPLYLKMLNFFDRHFNYKDLIKKIVKPGQTNQERALEIFKWTHKNIKKVPAGFSVIDDHVWYIIVRGYGKADQSALVFVTLCNYAGIRAFYSIISSQDRKERHSFSFVKLYKKWHIFDPYYGVYFKNRAGKLASIEDIKSNNWTIESMRDTKLDINYNKYFENLPDIEAIGLNRANIQSPLNRIIFELRKWLKSGRYKHEA